MDAGCPCYPAIRVETLPALTCNSPNRDSDWAARATCIFQAAAKHNKQDGQPRKLFSFLFQLSVWTSACSLLKTYLLHCSLQNDCRSVWQMTLANSNYEKIHLALPYLCGLSPLRKPE